MSEQEPSAPPPSPPLELQSNPGIGILRFFLWLMPAGITVGSLFLFSWLDSFHRGLGRLAIPLGITLAILCAWFDARLSHHCRSGRRSIGVHMQIFLLIEGLFIVPAILIATVYAICAANPW